MLDSMITNSASLNTWFNCAWSLNPWSRKMNFMCWLMEPIAPMEQALPISSSQKARWRTRYPKSCGGGGVYPS
jgi:hypothetical protein